MQYGLGLHKSVTSAHNEEQLHWGLPSRHRGLYIPHPPSLLSPTSPSFIHILQLYSPSTFNPIYTFNIDFQHTHQTINLYVQLCRLSPTIDRQPSTFSLNTHHPYLSPQYTPRSYTHNLHRISCISTSDPHHVSHTNILVSYLYSFFISFPIFSQLRAPPLPSRS